MGKKNIESKILLTFRKICAYIFMFTKKLSLQPRKDKLRNLDKVTATLVKNPLATQRELAKKIGISRSTVCEALKDIEQTHAKDERIIHLTDEDFIIQRKIQTLKLEKLEKNPDEISDADINQWDRHSMQRYQLFRGSITDAEGGLKDLNITWEE